MSQQKWVRSSSSYWAFSLPQFICYTFCYPLCPPFLFFFPLRFSTLLSSRESFDIRPEFIDSMWAAKKSQPVLIRVGASQPHFSRLARCLHHWTARDFAPANSIIAGMREEKTRIKIFQKVFRLVNNTSLGLFSGLFIIHTSHGVFFC